MDTTQQIIWAAGFIDGEGTLTIKRYRRGKSISYQPYISCTQVNKPVNAEAIEELKTLFGGSIHKWKVKNVKWANVTSWSVVSQDAKRCVNALLPYLRIKTRQARLILKFFDLKKEKHQLSQRERTERENLFYEMRKLNCKGKLRLQRLSEGTA